MQSIIETMAFLIEDEETIQLVHQIAELTGESHEVVVKNALRERWERHFLADVLLEIGRDCAARLKEPYKSIDHGELLYDENGLPK